MNYLPRETTIDKQQKTISRNSLENYANLLTVILKQTNQSFIKIRGPSLFTGYFFSFVTWRSNHPHLLYVKGNVTDVTLLFSKKKFTHLRLYYYLFSLIKRLLIINQFLFHPLD